MNLESGKTASWLDGVAIAGSVICMVHCLALPVFLATLPAWSRWLGASEGFHLGFLLLAVPLSSLVLWKSARDAEGRKLLLLGVTGLALLGLGVAMEGQAIEPWVTTLGATVLASAHFLNWRRRSHCSG